MQGVTSSKNDGFSLASGDFPTLGSEKDNSGKNMESQGCLLINIYVRLWSLVFCMNMIGANFLERFLHLVLWFYSL